MTASGVSVRSLFAAGIATAAVGAVALVPVSPAAPRAITVPGIQLSAAVQALFDQPGPTAAVTATAPTANASASAASAGDWIINGYEAVQPWIEYGFELADYALGFIPGLWWIAPAVDLVYFTAQPLVESAVYSFAYLLNGQFALIGPTIQAGIQNSISNAVQYAIYWLESIVPLPPLPPFPPFPGAAVAGRITAPTASRAAAAQPVTETITATAEAAAPAVEAATDVVVPTVTAPAKSGVSRNSLRAPHAATGPSAAAVAAAATASAPAETVPTADAATDGAAAETPAPAKAARQSGATRSASDHAGKAGRSANRSD